MSRCQEILDRVGTLPPLPDTAVKLMQVVNDPAATVEELVEAIQYDQAVTSELLRICNSAFFGLSRRISSLTEAMIRLGTVKVLQLVMSIHTNSMLVREQAGYGLPPGALWKHSVAVALASSIVAQKVKLPNAGLVFTAGLLHDIGKVVLNSYVADDFAEIVRRVAEEKLDFRQAEEQVLGFSHDHIGGRIAEQWRLPEPIVRCIQHHHDPDALDPTDPLVDNVYLANSTCLLLGIGIGEDGLCYRANPAVMQRHDLSERDLEDIGAQTLVELKRVESLFTAGDVPPANPAATGQEHSNVS